MQRSFAEVDGFRKQRKVTRRERSWPRWSGCSVEAAEARIEPHLSEGGNGRQTLRLERMLRIHFLQQWYNLSDPATEDALHDIAVVRRFAGWTRAAVGCRMSRRS